MTDTDPAHAFRARLDDYATHTRSYGSTNERALHRIAVGLLAEADRLTAERDRLKRDLKAGQAETHIVTDDSEDPEHADDCPGCEPIELHVTSVQDVVWCDTGEVEVQATDTTGRPVLLHLTEGQAAATRADLPEPFDGPCWHLHCAVCQADDRHGSGICFPNGNAALAYGGRHGWRLDGDRQVCPRCATTDRDGDPDERELGIADRDETATDPCGATCTDPAGDLHRCGQEHAHTGPHGGDGWAWWDNHPRATPGAPRTSETAVA